MTAHKYIWLADVVLHNGSTTVTYRWCSGDGWSSRTDASVVYQPRLVEPGNFEVFLFQSGVVGGRSELSVGEIVINNADHALDALMFYGWDGRSVTLRRGLQSNAEVANFDIEFTGTIEAAEWEWNTIRAFIRDRLSEVYNKPLVTSLYAGTNSLPSGVEGVEDDLKGLPKPYALGEPQEIPCVLVNTSRVIKQLCIQQVQTIDNVYVRGVEITAGTARASLAALEANIPTTGTYDYYLGASGEGAFIRLHVDDSQGLTTANIRIGATAANRTMARCVESILTGPGGLVSGDIVAQSFTDLDTANSAVVQFYQGTSEATVGQAVDEILKGDLGYWTLNEVGKFLVGRITDLTGTAIGTVRYWDMLDAEIIAASDPRRGIPAYQFRAGYERIYSVADENTLAGVALDRLNYLGQEFRYTETTVDSAVQAKHPTSVIEKFNTQFLTKTAADTAAARRKTLFGTFRPMVAFSMDAARDPGFIPGDLITVDTGRTQWTGASGRKMVVIGKARVYALNQVRYTVWG